MFTPVVYVSRAASIHSFVPHRINFFFFFFFLVPLLVITLELLPRRLQRAVPDPCAPVIGEENSENMGVDFFHEGWFARFTGLGQIAVDM